MVRVQHQKHLNLSIPLSATNFSTYNPLKQRHKFTIEALEEFITVAQELSIDVRLPRRNLAGVTKGNPERDHLRSHSNLPRGDK